MWSGPWSPSLETWGAFTSTPGNLQSVQHYSDPPKSTTAATLNPQSPNRVSRLSRVTRTRRASESQNGTVPLFVWGRFITPAQGHLWSVSMPGTSVQLPSPVPFDGIPSTMDCGVSSENHLLPSLSKLTPRLLQMSSRVDIANNCRALSHQLFASRSLELLSLNVTT